MKGFNILLVFLFTGFTAFGQNNTVNIDAKSSFGASFTEIDVVSMDKMLEKYEKLKVKDSVSVKFKGKVLEVCQAKGCWMTLQLNDGNEAMVRFKDYGFFMPKDISGKEVVVNGLAFVEEMSVDDQKHFAKDGGATQEEIARIKEPKRTFGFEASGVLLKN
ncbi:DUF4920 domain-containing protein [Maribacter sp. PR1]|uniref:DUF4920 domain-containing protein n=1 Tax=Maribacter cobaltidurans TaxID=1178778 RepID=A0ABU7IY87_9FLAO|nr:MULTISPECIES: DUF4920 domain-containing protein [Maribacter]MDC6390366.1 DUF4920 domain-containing protein [Maribacter sp. PR1]MEE1977756.1 DUF4920 domain-containing protein [Maribacter cobaltidurans]